MAYFYNPAHVDARWNGRQIRNACQMALALAEFRAHERRTHKASHAASETAVHLKVKDFKAVAEVYLDIINYLNTLHGFDTQRGASQKGIRAQDLEVLKRRVERFEQDKAEKKAAADKEKEAHTASMNPLSRTPSATTGAAAQADFSSYSHQQSYGRGGGGGGVGGHPFPPVAAAISPASQPIPPAQAPTGTAPLMASPPTYAQPGYYNYGPPAGGGYWPPPPPQGAPMYNPWYQYQQQQPPYGGAPQPPYWGVPQPPYWRAPQPPTYQAPPPNSQQYYQSQPPPGTGEGPQGQPLSQA
jgi:hypothetical protein